MSRRIPWGTESAVARLRASSRGIAARRTTTTTKSQISSKNCQKHTISWVPKSSITTRIRNRSTSCNPNCRQKGSSSIKLSKCYKVSLRIGSICKDSWHIPNSNTGIANISTNKWRRNWTMPKANLNRNLNNWAECQKTWKICNWLSKIECKWY